MIETIDRNVADAVERLRAASERIRQSEPPELIDPKFAVLAKLEKQGYPLRHRENLELMEGPSLAKAIELKPRTAKDGLLVLIGERGPGKTQMATWWAFQRGLDCLPVGIYVKCTDLFAEIAATFGGAKGKQTEEDILKRYRTTAYLVIDELQEKGVTDWHSRILTNILDHRYDDRLVTVLIANLSKANALQEINPSILSRAQETGGLIVCDWPSYRTGK